MESLVISLLLFGVLVFLAWVFVKGIANMEPDGAAAGGFMILILIPVFIIVLIVFLWYTISSGGWLYLGLAILVPVYLLARLVRSDSGPSIPEKNEHLEKCSRICADPSIALEEIKADPDVIEHLPPEIRNRPEVIALTEDKAFVLQIIGPEAPPFVNYQNRDAYQARRDRFGDSIFPGEKWRRLRYLPEHWRSDKEVIKVAFHNALEAFSETSPDYDGNPDEFLFGSGIGDLFDLIPDELLNDPEMLFEFEQALIATLAPHIPLLDNDDWGYTEVFGDSLEMYELDDFPSLDSLGNLKWYLDAMEEHRSSWEDAPIISHPIPDRLLQAVKNSRGVIDFYRVVITDESDKENIKTAFHDALKALSATPTDYDKDPVKVCFESGIGDLCDLIPDELLNDPKMLLEFEQALIATLVPHILDGTYPWQDTDWFQYFLEEQELDEFPSPDSLANLTCYLDAMEDATVSPPDYDDSRALSHPIPDRLVNAVSNAREEIDALAAEKEQQRLRKTLVDELSNLRNSKTA